MHLLLPEALYSLIKERQERVPWNRKYELKGLGAVIINLDKLEYLEVKGYSERKNGSGIRYYIGTVPVAFPLLCPLL